MTVLEKLNSGFTLLDGGMGTELQKKGLPAGEYPERWCLTHPEIVTDIHSAYLKAGSDIIATNTFGANSIKFGDELEECILAAISCAKTAADAYSTKEKPRFVALDIGPLGKLLHPLGDLAFETAVSIFSKTISIGAASGNVDLILIETMNDSYETKAAVLAAKESCDLPIFVTNVYDAGGKLMTGANAAAMVAMLEGLRVDALGLNCSLGPKEMMPIVETLVSLSSTPVIVKPNAGLPTVRNGKTEFDITPQDFSAAMLDIANLGVSVLGGCCGTNPEYIAALSDVVLKSTFKPISKKENTIVSSYTHAVLFNDKPILIGERINPTGKKRLKQALKENDMAYLLKEGIRQADTGVDILDVNVGLPEIDEADLMCRAVTELQAVTDLPLQIDTASPEVLEKALRLYNGKPMINSVNGKQKSMDSVFPLAAKYGGLIVALTLDENGIPDTAQKRVDIAHRIISEAKKYGIAKKDIIVDPLAMAVSADNNAAKTTLQTVSLLTAEGIKTSLGVSNVSFGLPNRDFITSTFFAMALTEGLSAAIMNPDSFEMWKAYHSFVTLSGKDDNCTDYISFAANIDALTPTVFKNITAIDTNENLFSAIGKGLKTQAATLTEAALEQYDPMTVINEYIIPALDEVGRGFEAKTIYLPQLLMSAEAATAAFEVVKKRLPKTSPNDTRPIVLATVQGDIHDIGKNIVRVLLENYGFSVIDLGRDVPPEKVVEAAQKHNAFLVGLSALMTTTVPAMAETVSLIKKSGLSAKTVVGGAVLTAEYAAEIGADAYAKSAMDTVRYAEENRV